MPMKRCACGCGREFVPRNGRHRFASELCRLRGRKGLERVRYGREHREMRRRVAAFVASGAAVCSRCGEPIRPDEPFDLDHADNGDGYRGPSHSDCNRAAPNSRRAEPADFRDDPGKSIYWGPPSEPGGTPRRWSRRWFEWR